MTKEQYEFLNEQVKAQKAIAGSILLLSRVIAKSHKLKLTKDERIAFNRIAADASVNIEAFQFYGLENLDR